MIHFILATFALLAAAFWILSGGNDFEPERRPEPVAVVAPAPEPVTAAQPEPQPVSTPTPAQPAAAATSLPVASTPPVANFTLEPAPAPQPEPAAQPEPAPQPAPPPEPEPIIEPDYRTVAASRVNMRSGPSTDYRVLDTLTQGTDVEILEIDDLGAEPWARLLVLDTGIEGWMATRFLSAE